MAGFFQIVAESESARAPLYQHAEFIVGEWRGRTQDTAASADGTAAQGWRWPPWRLLLLVLVSRAE